MNEQILLSQNQPSSLSTPTFLNDWNKEEQKRILRNKKLSTYKNVNKSFKETVRHGIWNSHRPEFYLYLTEISENSEELRGFYNDVAMLKSNPHFKNVIESFGYPNYELFCSNDAFENNLNIIKNQNPEISFSPLIPSVASIISLYFQPDLAYITIQAMINKNNKYFTKSKTELIVMLKSIEKIINDHSRKLYDHFKFLKLNVSEVALLLFPVLFSKCIDENVALTIFDAYMCDGRIALTRYIVGIFIKLQAQLLTASTISEFINIIITYLTSLDNPDELAKLIHVTFNLGYTKRKKILYLEQQEKMKNNEYLLYRIGSQLPKIDEFQTFFKFSPIFGSSTSGTHTYNGSRHSIKITIDQVVNSSIHNGKLITISQFEKLRNKFHSRHRRLNAYPIYLMSVDGTSLLSFYEKSKNCSPCMVVIKTGTKTIGAVLDDALSPKYGNKYYGSAFTSVFDINNNEIYKTSLKNNYYLSVQRDSISIGGGGTGCAIYLEDMFEHVVSDPCESFDSPSLLPSQRVPIIDIELYKLAL